MGTEGGEEGEGGVEGDDHAVGATQPSAAFYV